MKHVVCNLCGQDDWHVRFPATLRASHGLNVEAFRCTSPGYGEHAQIVQCNVCGHVYANPRWSGGELFDAYAAVEDTTYLQEQDGRRLTFRKHLVDLEKRTGPANGRRLLDVGAYIGIFVEVAQQAGWDACGVEPSAWAAREAQRNGLRVLEGTQDAPELRGQQFDVITMWDVIEHVADPRAELTKALQLLKPGGMVAVHTMDIDSMTARLMGRRWPWLMNMHIHYFSQRSLRRLLTEVGYDVIWSGAQGRYLSLGYLGTRVAALNRFAGTVANKVIRALSLSSKTVPIFTGDLFTIFAVRPETTDRSH